MAAIVCAESLQTSIIDPQLGSICLGNFVSGLPPRQARRTVTVGYDGTKCQMLTPPNVGARVKNGLLNAHEFYVYLDNRRTISFGCMQFQETLLSLLYWQFSK